MRNPNRIANFLNCLVPYENNLLTDALIGKIIRDVIKNKLYIPYFVKRSPILKAICNDDNATFDDDDLDLIIANSPQKHKEAGFAYGWASRFDTWYKWPMELGFIRYSMNAPIEISDTGHLLIAAQNEQPPNEQKMQALMLNAMVKYQTNNPFRKNKSANSPLILLLQVIKKLREKNAHSKGIYRNELSFFICWTNDDATALCNKIINFRKRYKFSQYTNELIYRECLKIMGYTLKDCKYINITKVTTETVDEYIRKMRGTGIVSLRGNGRFVDFNDLERQKIEYILRHYSIPQKLCDKNEYFLHMSAIDEKLITIRSPHINDDDVKQRMLHKCAINYSKEAIFHELKNLCAKKGSKDPLFNVIAEPVRLEFLTSIALVQNLNEVNVHPNYTTDDEGVPLFTSAGGKADIVCTQKETQSLVEVTLMRGRQQLYNEIIPISRHLSEALAENTNTTAIFIAPNIHIDVKRYVGYIKYQENLNIKPYAIDEFIYIIKNANTLKELTSKEQPPWHES